MKKTLFFILLGLLLLMAVVVRFISLDQYPPILNRDEAALALNALYIKQASVDEWGIKTPLQFKSFGDYKLPGYIYILSLFLWLGENDTLVRTPSAIAGVASILLASYWMYSLSFQKGSGSKVVLLFLLIGLSFSPFAIFYSRMAWEANVGLSLMLAALVCMYHPIRSWRKDALAVLFSLSAAMTYNSPFLLLPFVILSLPIHRGVKQIKTWIGLSVALCVVCLLTFLLFSQNNAQKSSILFFTDGDVLAKYPDYRANLPEFLRPLIGSKYGYFAQLGVEHYLATFSPEFLIIRGGQHPWHSILGQGHLYWTVYFFFWIGMISQIFLGISVFKKRNWQQSYELLPLYFLLTSPLPSIFTTDAPHATRSLFTLIMIVLISAIGFQKMLSFLRRHSVVMRNAVAILAVILISLESTHYVYRYFFIWPTDFSRDFQIPFLGALKRVSTEHQSGNIGIMDSGLYLYALVGWYQKIPVDTAIKTIERSGPDPIGLFHVKRIGRYYFVYHQEDFVPDKQGMIIRGETFGEWENK